MAMTATHFAQAGRRRPAARSALGMGFDIRFRAAVLRRRGHRPALDGDVGIERKERLAGWITQLEGDAPLGASVCC